VSHAFKVVIVGETGVGKSSMMHNYVHGKFINQKPTVGADFHSKQLVINDTPITVHLWDTAGQERFNALTMQYFRGLSGIVLVFSVTSTQSLSAARRWYEQALKHCTNSSPPTILVGNKIDLVDNGTPREVSTNDVNNFVQALPGDTREVKYMEISAKDHYEVEKCFVTLSQAMMAQDENWETSPGNKTVENSGINAAGNPDCNKTVENTGINAAGNSDYNKTVENSAGNNTARNSAGNNTVVLLEQPAPRISLCSC